MIEKVQQQIIVDDLGTAVIIHPETSSDNVLHQGGTLDELITLDQKRKRNFNFMGNKVVQDGLMGAYQNVTTKLDTGIIADDYFIAIDFIFNGNTSVGQPILGNIGVGGGCYFQARANTGNFSFNPNDGSIVDSGVKVNIGNNKLLMSVNKSKVVFLLNGEIKSYDVSINTSNRNIVFLSPSSVSSSISTQIIIRNATIYNRQLTPQEIQHNFTVLNNSPSINTLHAGDKKLLLSTDTDHVTDRAGRTQEQINRRFYKRNCKEFTSTGGAITVNNAEEGYVLSAEIKGQTVKNYALTNNTEKTITATGAVICPTMQVPTQTLVTLAFIAKDVMDDTFIRIAFDGGYIVDNTNRRVSNGLNLIPVTLNVTQGKTGLYMGTFNGTFKANNFMILDGDARGKINSYIPFGLSSTQAILSNSGSLYPIYEPFIVGKTRILTPEGATVETGLVPTDPTLPALKDGDKLDLATRVITFANATTRQLTEEEVKAYRNFKKVILCHKVGDVADTFALNEDGSGLWNNKVFNFTFKGNETLTMREDRTNTIRVSYNLPFVSINTSLVACSHLPYQTPMDIDQEGVSIGGGTSSPNVLIFAINKAKLVSQDINGVMKYVIDNSVKFYIQLATPIVTTIDKSIMPTIQTVDKINILNVDSPVAPSKLTLTLPVDRIGEMQTQIDSILATLSSPSNAALTYNYIEDEYNKNIKHEKEVIL